MGRSGRGYAFSVEGKGWKALPLKPKPHAAGELSPQCAAVGAGAGHSVADELGRMERGGERSEESTASTLDRDPKLKQCRKLLEQWHVLQIYF